MNRMATLRTCAAARPHGGGVPSGHWPVARRADATTPRVARASTPAGRLTARGPSGAGGRGSAGRRAGGRGLVDLETQQQLGVRPIVGSPRPPERLVPLRRVGRGEHLVEAPLVRPCRARPHSTGGLMGSGPRGDGELRHSQEPRGVVVEDVVLLCVRQKRCRFDCLDCLPDQFRPHHLI